MILVCAAISVNIVKELKHDHEIEMSLTKKIVDENSEQNTSKLIIENTKSPITNSSPVNKEKGCEENNEFYFLNFFGKLFLAFTAGVIFSDGVYIKMGIV